MGAGGVSRPSSQVVYDIRTIAPPLKTTAFDLVCFTVTGTATIAVLLLYLLGLAVVTDVFFDELTAYLEILALYKCQIVIAEDFNIHMDINDDRHAMTLYNIITSFDYIQQVPLQPTHHDGGTLDLFMTGSFGHGH